MSCNLISSSQHPEVVSANLCKEIQLGQVAGPFPFLPLPNFQSHPVGVVPKNTPLSGEPFIYHLSYQEGDNINDHIPKDPYSLQYVCIDDVISILQQLGPGSFMAKTELKSAFCLMPIHPDDWNLLGIYWQFEYYVDLYLPFAVSHTFSTRFQMPWNGLLKHNYGLQHVIHTLDNFTFLNVPNYIVWKVLPYF